MKPLFFFVLTFVLFHNTSAQTQWKKDVSRLVPFIETRAKSPKGFLVEELIQAAISGQVETYQNLDAYFTYPLTSAKVKDITSNKPDTISVVDPTTGKERIVITDRVFNTEYIDKYKLHEEWIFDRPNGKTEIRILGIAPAADIYNEDGSYRATQPMFWFKYNDVATIISNHKNLHLADSIWHDYMKMAGIKTTPNSTGIQKRLMIRTIDISLAEDTINYHLRDITNETTYIEYIMNSVKQGMAKAYANNENNFGAELTPEAFLRIFESKPDTVVVEDPVTRKEVIQVVRRDFDPGRVSKYKLLEEWSFDPAKGETTIQITGIAPTLDINNDDGSFRENKPMFWIHFSDFSSIFPTYEIYHHEHTFSDLVWQSYFQTPEYVK